MSIVPDSLARRINFLRGMVICHQHSGSQNAR